MLDRVAQVSSRQHGVNLLQLPWPRVTLGHSYFLAPEIFFKPNFKFTFELPVLQGDSELSATLVFEQNVIMYLDTVSS